MIQLSQKITPDTQRQGKDRHHTFNQTIQEPVFGLYEVRALGFPSHHPRQHARKFGSTETASIDCHRKLKRIRISSGSYNCQLIEPEDQCWPYEEILYNIYSTFVFYFIQRRTLTHTPKEHHFPLSETKVQKQVSGKMRIKDPRPEDPKCSSQTSSNQHQQGTCLKC